MTSSKNGDETEVRMRHSCIPVSLSSINEKLTKTQRAHIECTPFKWAMDISNNFSISGGLLRELIIDRVVATEDELKYDIVNAALFEQGQPFVDVIDYHRLVAENKDFKKRISVLEYEVRMMKEARVNTSFEDKVVQDDR
ncbi:hypothetical protein KIW84_051005 [Lathyrus oleraceus]|uniref:Uncharacterized protein n=1 Tax=Pisum sativum TaxID=3888 RepID=A0A9D5AD67_PEA|nr:hypothetical protein KIW84_051005 [Pisum sativum]